ncbi:MAG: CBS domain-containing protein [Gemmatimonadetes bacterium]|uniref:CBS domain-containing protein n=1 Tax=Candidatus Kutchimonas denitrificans TaxID=3056748 RepID=A0AAE4Z8Z4_9BACT|nr:CBS domain-containing protein [Gemmatimonadota bacterium]NIR75223.1 CBS domain-containing protein [Candidatus Kutchimonas denitrificans]NIS00161.1 CBS domain-containing protein [Gemmatimonadota bacterium]NIT65753.1 CBS domain-containing protein [Gemmatimonadota bacterium]NIU53031.1 CBS domain-containing protein [Gemmatimonadota bacterium]
MDNPTTISRLLPAEHLVIGLKARTLEEALGQLIERLDEADQITDRAALDALVADEIESGEAPSLGDRAILMHFRTDAVDELVVAVGTANKPFAFAPDDSPEADLLILILTPRTATRPYLKTLAALSEFLADPAIPDALVSADSVDEFLDVVASRDLVIRPELTVRDLMSRDVHAVSPETLLSEALRLMARHRRRGVPVVSDNGEVLGMVTEQELLQHFLPQILGTAPRDGSPPPVKDLEVRDVMQRSVMCLPEDQLISDVLGTMLTERVSQFPVVKEGKLVGFLSRTDLIQKLLEKSI